MCGQHPPDDSPLEVEQVILDALWILLPFLCLCQHKTIEFVLVHSQEAVTNEGEVLLKVAVLLVEPLREALLCVENVEQMSSE